MIGCLEVFRILRSSIDKNEPCSLIRIGDGESRVLQGNKEYVYKRQFGYVPEENIIIPSLQEAYANADIVGVPTERHKSLSDYWAKAESFIKGNPLKCSIDIHLEFLKADLYSPLINESKVFYISGRDLNGKIESYFNCDVESFTVTPEILFEENKNQPRHYPEQFFEVMSWIHSINCTGKLCLVGAGILGKIYANEFKKCGGIVMDIGCVFDLWSGKVTRGKNKGVNSYDDKFKI